jgi:hypothetical protein
MKIPAWVLQLAGLLALLVPLVMWGVRLQMTVEAQQKQILYQGEWIVRIIDYEMNP